MASVVALSKSYAATEQYIESKYDIHIQKIGQHYKAFLYVLFPRLTACCLADVSRSLLSPVYVLEVAHFDPSPF